METDQWDEARLNALLGRPDPHIPLTDQARTFVHRCLTQGIYDSVASRGSRRPVYHKLTATQRTTLRTAVAAGYVMRDRPDKHSRVENAFYDLCKLCEWPYLRMAQRGQRAFIHLDLLSMPARWSRPSWNEHPHLWKVMQSFVHTYCHPPKTRLLAMGGDSLTIEGIPLRYSNLLMRALIRWACDPEYCQPVIALNWWPSPLTKETIPMAVKLFRDERGYALQTEAQSEAVFTQQLTQLLGQLIETGTYDQHWPEVLRPWMEQAVNICCAYRGYKVEEVEQRTLYTAGRVPSQAQDPQHEIRDESELLELALRHASNGRA